MLCYRDKWIFFVLEFVLYGMAFWLMGWDWKLFIAIYLMFWSHNIETARKL